MKKPLLILFLLLSIYTNAQQQDSTTQSIMRIQTQRLDTIQLNLQKFSNEFRTGTIMIFVGMGFTGVSAIAYSQRHIHTNSQTGIVDDPKGALYGMYGGIGFSLVGGLVQIAAHKWIRLASGIKKKPSKRAPMFPKQQK